jgi:hypothetical protein
MLACHCLFVGITWKMKTVLLNSISRCITKDYHLLRLSQIPPDRAFALGKRAGFGFSFYNELEEILLNRPAGYANR